MTCGLCAVNGRREGQALHPRKKAPMAEKQLWAAPTSENEHLDDLARENEAGLLEEAFSSDEEVSQLKEYVNMQRKIAARNNR